MKEIRTRVKELKELMTKQRDELQMAQQKVQALEQSQGDVSEIKKQIEKPLPGSYKTFGETVGQPAVFTGKTVSVQDILAQNQNVFSQK